MIVFPEMVIPFTVTPESMEPCFVSHLYFIVLVSRRPTYDRDSMASRAGVTLKGNVSASVDGKAVILQPCQKVDKLGS